MKIDKYPLKLFSDSNNDMEVSLLLLQGSKFLKVTALPDGIFAWYMIPELEVPMDQKETFYFHRSSNSVPNNAEFIDIIDVIVQSPKGEQGVVVFPIFRLQESKIIGI